MQIREALIDDIPAITEIYNYAILHTDATFDTELKKNEEQRLWFNAHGYNYPLLVGIINGKVKGWASLSRYSDRCAYRSTVELSVYVDIDAQGKGIGRSLMVEVLRLGKERGLHAVISRITSGNQISIAMHKKLGFFMVGELKEVGVKFNKLLDVVIMQKIL